MIIYKIENIVNNKVYVGQTAKSLSVRKRSHLCELRNNRHKNTKLQNAVNKYGLDNFTFDVLDQAESEKELNNKEIYWMNHYNAIEVGYNIRGGGHDRTVHHDTKEKIRRSKLGSKNPMYGKRLSNRTRKLMSQSHKGIIPWHKGTIGKFSRSNATKQKLRLSKLGSKNPMYGKTPSNKGVAMSDSAIQKMSKTWSFLDPLGKPVTFVNLEQFCRLNGLITSCMHAVHTGKRNHHKGWRRLT